MPEQSWYVVSYDVAGARHGQRVHRHLKRNASMLLESLYLYRGTTAEVTELLRQLRRYAGPSASDVVVYGLRGPFAIRTWGKACQPAGIINFSLPAMLEYRDRIPGEVARWKVSGNPDTSCRGSIQMSGIGEMVMLGAPP